MWAKRLTSAQIGRCSVLLRRCKLTAWEWAGKAALTWVPVVVFLGNALTAWCLQTLPAFGRSHAVPGLYLMHKCLSGRRNCLQCLPCRQLCWYSVAAIGRFEFEQSRAFVQ
jgi:hypothetical protein